jgi:hypothetical protein
VKLSNIRVYCKGGGTKEQATSKPAEKENTYPEPTMFGDTPSYGFFIRHVKDIELNNVELKLMSDDFRPAIVMDDVKGAEFVRFKAPHAQGVPTITAKSVDGLLLQQCWGLADTNKQQIDQEQF